MLEKILHRNKGEALPTAPIEGRDIFIDTDPRTQELSTIAQGLARMELPPDYTPRPPLPNPLNLPHKAGLTFAERHRLFVTLQEGDFVPEDELQAESPEYTRNIENLIRIGKIVRRDDGCLYIPDVQRQLAEDKKKKEALRKAPEIKPKEGSSWLGWLRRKNMLRSTKDGKR